MRPDKNIHRGSADTSSEDTEDPSLPPRLRPDCGACCALCCVAPAFDAAQGFGYNKPAHTPCVNLLSDFRCNIHGSLAARGFPGCVTFDCYGAGQRVTQEIFKGATWRDPMEAGHEMFDVFTRLCVLHELMALITIALNNFSENDLQDRLSRMLLEIEALCDAEPAHQRAADVSAIKNRTMELLRGLKSFPATAALRS